MSAVESQDKRLDPGLKVNLPTNNPFRRANSPLNSPPADLSNPKNPFLDPELLNSAASPPRQMAASPPKAAVPQAGMAGTSPDRRVPPPPPGTRRPDNAVPGQAAARLLQMKPGQAPPDRHPRGPDPRGADPRGAPRHRSEDRKRTPSEERRREERRERRRKEKEEGLKDSQGRPVPSSSGRSKRRGPHLDPIDKLDTTGAFLFGGGYHVAGPYDATVPKHAKGKHAPIEAFAADSLNMVMGGKARIDKHVHAQHANMYGHVDDAVNDYANKAAGKQIGTDPYDSARPVNNRGQQVFDSATKVDPIHGVETGGLGTSTFLDGAPASSSAIRRESESNDGEPRAGGGLGRTRSLAQRFKSVRGRDRSNSSGVVYSPEPAYARAGSPSNKGNPTLSGGGLDKISEKGPEKNPFFTDYSDAYDQKGEMIRAAKGGQTSVTLEDKGPAPAAPNFSKPKPVPLTRSVTEGSTVNQHQRSDSNNSSDAPKPSNGLLGRMKSLRTKKKERSQE